MRSKWFVALIVLVVAVVAVLVIENSKLITAVPSEYAVAVDSWRSKDLNVSVMNRDVSLGVVGVNERTDKIVADVGSLNGRINVVVSVDNGKESGDIIYFSKSSDAYKYLNYCRKIADKGQLARIDWDGRAVYFGDRDIYYALL